jgi:ABC-type nitrate/sulfonate/bicarbonate transport system ATPase subunit
MASPASSTHAVTNTAFEVRFDAVGRSFAAANPRRGESPEDHLVLRDINITIEPGELVAILGTSGCGKSTLLRITAGLDTGFTGNVTIDGTPAKVLMLARHLLFKNRGYCRGVLLSATLPSAYLTALTRQKAKPEWLNCSNLLG